MCANKMYVTYNTEKPAITIQGAFIIREERRKSFCGNSSTGLNLTAGHLWA